MFDDVLRRVDREYRRRVLLVLSENAEYMRRHHSFAAADCSAKWDTKYRRIVVPQVLRMPRYRFYVHTDTVMPSQDDPILRYVPLIQNNTEYEDVLYFESTDLAERPLCREDGVREMLMKRIFGLYSDLELFNLKTDIAAEGPGGGVPSPRFSLLVDLSEYLQTPLHKLLRVWEEMFDKKRRTLYFDENALDFYFCNICYVFDCCMHDSIHIRNKIRRASPESGSAGKRRMGSLHRVFCTRGDSAQTEHAHETESSFVARCYSASPCVSSLFLYFATQAKVPCRQLRGPRKRFVLKRETSPQRHKAIRHEVFYSQCHHAGVCFGNSKCLCWKGMTYCEDMCFCECCDNYFPGCACRVCDTKCMCMVVARECTARCTCRRCLNQFLAAGEEKKTYVGKSLISGFGLFAGENIRAESLIVEYTGEIITNVEAERRGHFYEKMQVSYLFDVSVKNNNVHHTIDAMTMGNNSRFANHSSRPNARARSVQVNGVKRIGIYALEDIRKHTEIVFDYQYSDEHKRKYKIQE